MLCHRGFKLDLGEKFLMERSVKHWPSCPGQWESLYPWRSSNTRGMLHPRPAFCGERGVMTSGGFANLNDSEIVESRI